MRLIEREAEAEHPRPLLPTVDQRAVLWAIEGKVPQYGEPVGVLAGRLDRQFVGIGVPSRRMDDGGVNARFIHLLQQIVLGEGRYLSVGRIGRQTAAPDMDLCVNSQHGVLLPTLSGGIFGRNAARGADFRAS